MSSTPRHSISVVCCAWLLLGGAGAPATAASKTMTVPSDSSVEIMLTPWFENLPPAGYVPVTAEIRNRSQASGTWTVLGSDMEYMHGGTLHSTLPVTVAGGAEARARLLVPLIPVYGTPKSSRMYKRLSLSVTGPGVELPGMAGGLTSDSKSSNGSDWTNFTLVSEAFEQQLGSSWRGRLHAEWLGDVVKMIDAPLDWRGYSGVAQLWLMEPEWQALSTQQREALMAWVAQGGSAIIVKSDDASVVALPESFGPWDGKERRHGLGTVETVERGLASARASSLVLKTDDIVFESSVGKLVQARADSLAALVPPLTMNGTLIFTFIAIFGIVVGPVNLFLLAAGPRRPRLFWTTPLISCLGTGFLMAIMVMQDGFGGTGARVTLALVLPQQKQMTVVQTQMAKTGVLLGHAFELPAAEAAWISPVPSPAPGESPYGLAAYRGSSNRSLAIRGSELSDGWFSSRSMQRQILCSQRLNRGGVEVGGGEAPHVISSLNTALKSFYYQDLQQRYWKADVVPVGQKTALKAVSKEDLMAWKKTAVAVQMDNEMRARIDRCLPLPAGWFFAEAAEPAKIAVPTLDSIQWSKDRAFVGGECTPAAGPP